MGGTTVFFNIGIKNKTVKQLRKDKGYTVKELAELLKVNSGLIQQVDDRKMKEVPEPLKSRIMDVLRN